MQKRISEIAEENKKLKEKLETKKLLIFKDNIYWLVSKI